MNHLNELLKVAQYAATPSIAIANPLGKKLMKAIEKAIDLELAVFHFFGNLKELQSSADEVGLNLRRRLIFLHEENENPAKAAVHFVSSGKADIVMKGNVSTKDLLQAVLDKESGLRGEKLLSHVAVFDVPGRAEPIILTDAAINIAPDFDQKAQIAINAVEVAHSLGTECPKIAAIAPVDVINEAIPSTLDAARLVEFEESGGMTGCMVGGPISFDNAISRETAKQKGVSSKVAGCSDILLVPSIEAGNALYKAFVFFAKAEVAAIVCGGTAPIVLPSRADSAQSKLYSMALAITIFSKKQKGRDECAANETDSRAQSKK